MEYTVTQDGSFSACRGLFLLALVRRGPQWALHTLAHPARFVLPHHYCGGQNYVCMCVCVCLRVRVLACVCLCLPAVVAPLWTPWQAPIPCRSCASCPPNPHCSSNPPCPCGVAAASHTPPHCITSGSGRRNTTLPPTPRTQTHPCTPSSHTPRVLLLFGCTTLSVVSVCGGCSCCVCNRRYSVQL